MKINYKRSELCEMVVIGRCPFGIKTESGQYFRVGSYSCTHCRFFKTINTTEKYVECSYHDKIKIYLASALFTRAEIEYNIKLYRELKTKGYEVFLPQDKCEGMTDSKKIADNCKKGIIESDILVVNMEGTDVDSGTSWECGYATALNKPIIGLRTDFRQRGDDGGLNCMLSQNVNVLITKFEIRSIVDEIDINIKRIFENG